MLTSLESQNALFYDTSSTGAFFSTPVSAPHVILRLKDGMDTSEPSTNGTSASNLYRLSSLLADDEYAKKGKETVGSFESEMLQYPWLFASFMPSIVAGKLGVRGIVVSEGKGKETDGEARGVQKIKEFEKAPRGGLGTFIKIDVGDTWLRERNGLLTRFGLDGKGRVLVCEGGICTEERDLEENVEEKVEEKAEEKVEGKVEEVKVSPPTEEVPQVSESTQTIKAIPIAEDVNPDMPGELAKIEKAEEVKGEDVPVAAIELKDLEKALAVSEEFTTSSVVPESSVTAQGSETVQTPSESIISPLETPSIPTKPVIDPALKKEMTTEQMSGMNQTHTDTPGGAN